MSTAYFDNVVIADTLTVIGETSTTETIGTLTVTGGATLGTLGVGTAPTSAAAAIIAGTVTAASAAARGLIVSPVLAAAANSDALTMIRAAATFTPGAFTGLVVTGISVPAFSVAAFTSPGSPIGISVGVITGTGASEASALSLAPPTGATTNYLIRHTTAATWNISAAGAYTAAVGTLATGANAFTLTATQATTNNSQIGVDIAITSAGSGASSSRTGMLMTLAAGATGSARTVALFGSSTVAGTNTDVLGSGFIGGNRAVGGSMVSTTTGTNIGAAAFASGGDVNYGAVFRATTDKSNATNIGVAGFGLQTLGTPIRLGGFFGLMDALPTYASAALMADNGATTSDIFVARDNGTAVLTIADGGLTTLTGTLQCKVSTTGGASINFGNAGTAPTSPNNGDAWIESNTLKLRLNGATVTVQTA